MTMEQLVLAGAPELPAGMFYRVVDEAYAGLVVSIRQRRKRLGSRRMASTYVRHEQFENGTDAVVDACRRALAGLEEMNEERRRLRDAARLLGDHDGRRHG